MIAPDKVHVLQGFLRSLPPAMASRLAKAVEVDRLTDGKALPHDLILEGLRPVLRQTDTDRTMTPQRLFCRPFEDLLVTGPRKEKQKGVIGRESIAAVWDWLGTGLAPEARRKFSEGVKTAILGFHREVAMSHAAEFWPLASEAILSALSSEAGRKAARKVLGGDLLVADATDMAHLLAVGPEILEIQTLLVRPVVSLPEDMLLQLREIYNRIAQKAPDAGPYIAVVAMRRLERPWEALKLPLFVSRQAGDTLISNTDMGLVGEVIFAQIDAHLSVIRGARHPQFDADALAGAVAGFAELSMGIVKEVEMRRDGKWGQRLMKARAAVAETMEGFLEKAPREVLAALPTHRSGYTGGPKAPDLARRPDLEKRERALNYAHLLIGCMPFASAASFGAALKTATEEVTNALRAYNEDILREMRSVEGEKRDHAESYFELAAALTSLFFSVEEGELLRRRGRAALAPPQAA
jgi:hypothetical protein